MTKSALITLHYEDEPVRVVVEEDGSLWFVVKDLGDTLDVYDSRARGGHEKWWEGRYDDSARFAGVEGTDPVHVVHLVSATDKTFD